MDSSSTSNQSLQLPQIIYDDPQYIKHFTDGREDLLKLAFVSHEKVHVEKSLSGYSGAQTWRVSTEKNQFFVVKLAHPTIIDQEDDNYRNHVAGGLYRNAAHPEDRPFKSENKRWALFKSTFLGLYQSQTLLQYLDKGSADIATILKNIFIDHGRRWWGAGEPTPIKCSVYYDRLLPAHLELDYFDGEDKGALPLKAGEVTQSDVTTIEEMVIKRQTPNILLKNFRPERIRNGVLTITATPQANVRSPQIRIKLAKIVDIVPEEIHTDPSKTLAFLTDKLAEGLYANNVTTRRQRIESYAEKAIDDFTPSRDTFVVESVRYPNPIVYLQKLLNENYNTKISPRIHGDLNLSNILIELDENNEGYQQPWLIDFAETGEGPILLDLQWLEEQVLTKFLAPILDAEMTKAGLSVNALIDILEALHEFRELPRDLPSSLQKPYTVLQEIRRLVRDNNYLSIKNDWSEYYRGLVITLIGSLRFEEREPFVHKVAFLSAATVIRWTKVSPHDLPKGQSPKGPKGRAPIIDSGNLPALILRNHSFWLYGKASTGSTVQVATNNVVLVTTIPDPTGNWQVEVRLEKVGRYSLIARDERSGLESPAVLIQVLEVPVIDKSSLLTQVSQRQKFMLQGTAQAGATVQVIANQQPLLIAPVDNTGNWKAEVAFEEAGEYQIIVRDNVTSAESAPAVITVIKRSIIRNALGLLPIGAVLFTLVGIVWFSQTDPGRLARDRVATKIAQVFEPQPETPVTPMPSPAATTPSTSTLLQTGTMLPTTTQTPLPPGATPAETIAPPTAKAAPVNTACGAELPAIKIGIAINASKRYSIFGKDQIIGYLLAIKYFNDRGGVQQRCIETVLVDLESSVETATLASKFQGLVDKGVVAIVGPGLSQQVAELEVMLKEITTPVIGPSTTRPAIVCGNPYFSRVSAPGQWYIKDTISEAVDQVIDQLISNKPKIALAYAEDDAFTKAEFDTVKDIIKQDSGKNYELHPEFYNYETTWSDTELEALATKINDANPHIVIISGLTLDGVTLIKQLRKVGYTGTLIGGNGLNTPYIFDNCTECNDLFVPQAYSHKAIALPMQQEFLAAYKAYQPTIEDEPIKPKADTNPGQFAAQMFSAVQVIVQSLHRLEIQDEDLIESSRLATLRAQLNQALLFGEFETPIGRFRFNPDGEIMQSRFYVAKSVPSESSASYRFEIVRTVDNIDPVQKTDGQCTTSVPLPQIVEQ